MRYAFRLFGPRKDQTVVINGHHFVNGRYDAIVGSDAAGTLMSVLSYYGAYAHGTPEYIEAMAKEEASNGGSDVSASAGNRKAESVSDEIRPNGAESPNEATVVSAGDVGSETGGSGIDPSGDGHGYAGIPKFEEAASIPKPIEPSSIGDETLRAAVLKLDPENDTHWVMTGAHKGFPKLSAVEDAFGRAGVTRQDIEAAIPHWSRDKAVEVALEA
jgi:hypothetical protein